VYCVFHKEVIQLDSLGGKKIGQIELPKHVEVETAFSTPAFDADNSGQVAVLFIEGQGIMLIDFTINRIWHVGEKEGWYVTNAAATPYGIAVTLYGRRKSVFVLDRSNWEVKSELV
jgi:hypothetical protein